ncbi:MAG: endonuclease III domain-containing protein [Candidatus Sumerlaeia bacterium]
MKQWKDPIVTAMSRKKREPFKVLIATVLSLRTKDDCTAEAAKRLFKLADTPRKILNLDEKTIAQAVYPVGFYNTKAKNILDICQNLVDRYNGQTPDEIDELLTLKGVGRKVANLVLTQGYNKPAICVDTHVHRITNRWGYVETSHPDETEMVLREVLPKKHWIIINDLLVTYGQNLCMPTSPWCSKCKIRDYCEQKGVKRSR